MHPKFALRIHTHIRAGAKLVGFPLPCLPNPARRTLLGVNTRSLISDIMQEDQLLKELDASQKELRLLRAENEDLKRKVTDFENIIGDNGRIHRSQVNPLERTHATFLVHQYSDVGTPDEL